MKKLFLGIVVLGLLWSNVSFATVEQENALLKSGKIKIGMSLEEFDKLPFTYKKIRIPFPTEKEIKKNKFSKNKFLIAGREYYLLVSYLGLPFSNENIFVFKKKGKLHNKSKSKKNTFLISIHKRSQKDFYSKFSNYDTWLEVEKFLTKHQGHSYWKNKLPSKYLNRIEIAKSIDNFVRTTPEKGFIKFICVSKRQPIVRRHQIVEINFPKRIFKSYYQNQKHLYEAQITYLDDRKLIYDSTGKFRISDNKLLEYDDDRECFAEEKFSITDIAKKEKPKDENEKISGASGTAFFIDNNGHMITNHHVIEGCKDKSQISYENNNIKAKLIAKDEFLDLALLKADVKNSSFINISTAPPKKLKRVIVAGYPFGLELSNDLKFNSGIITSLKGLGDDSTRIQIDAAINPGNSGGPIVYEDNGELAAVAVAGLSKDKTEAVNFGIKASSVKNFLQSNQIDLTLVEQKFNFSNDDLAELLESSTLYTFCK